ncbi:MAG TPA: protein translocase subunit SecD, partial [Allocoleopsis sp.]
MQRQRSLLALIIVLVIASVVTIAKVPVRLGLDLQGGSQLTLQVKPSENVKEITPRVMEAVQRVVEGRINGLGVSESVVQTVGEDQLLVQLPGVSDPEQAERVLGGTAQLDFRQQKPGTEAQLAVEFQVRQELLAKQAELQKQGAGNEAALAENQAALKRSNAAIAELFERTGLTGENLQDAAAEP